MKKTLFLAAITVAAMASCKKNDNGTMMPNNTNNGGADAQMSYQIVATNMNSNVAQKTTANSTILWTSAKANPAMVKFEAKKDNTEIEYKSTNNAQVDLMSPVALTFGGFTIPNGVYDEIELKIELDKNSAGNALELQGQFNNGVVSFPVLLLIDENIELKTEQKNVTVTDNTAIIAVTTLDLSTMILDVKEGMLLSGDLTNGVLIVSRNSNKKIYTMVVNNLRNKRHHCEFHFHKK